MDSDGSLASAVLAELVEVANDYPDVVARVRSLFRAGNPTGVLHVGPITLGADGKALLDGEPLHLTPTEFRLLRALLAHSGVTRSRRRLLEEVWGYDSELSGRVHTRTVDVHVMRLRAKLGDVGDWIESVHGFGYRFAR